MIEGDNTDAAAAVSAAPTAVAAAKSVGGAAEGAVEEERHQASIKIAEGENREGGSWFLPPATFNLTVSCPGRGPSPLEFQYLLEKSQQLFAGLR